MNALTQNWQQIIAAVRTTSLEQFKQAKQQQRNVSRKDDGSFVTQTDLALQQAISQTLARHLPKTPVLGEEMTTEQQETVLATGSCWLLDPLDGTSNFSHDIPVYTVSLALMFNGDIIAGMVFDPNQDELFSAIKGQGAWLNGTQLIQTENAQTKELKQAMSIIDTKRLPQELAIAIVTEHPYHSQRSFGSVALDWCWLAAGRVQTYLHGKQKLWDFAAGALIAQEAGCVCATMSGGSILSTPIDLKARSAVGATPSLAPAWQSWIQKNSVSNK